MSLATALSDSSAFMAITANVPTSQHNRAPFQELYKHNQADFAQVLRERRLPWLGKPFTRESLLAAVGVTVLSDGDEAVFTLRYPRVIQAVGRASIGWLKGLMEWFVPKGTYSESDISQYFWPNGKMPDRDAFAALAADDWASYRLRVGGLVAHPRDFTLADLRAMDKHEQITQHYCIQGWSGIAKWGGVLVSDIMAVVEPLPSARYAVFYSFADNGEPGAEPYYDSHKIEHMRNPTTLLAYEMNDEPLGAAHGAPLRLRNEVELGFKQVKWVAAIEFVESFDHLGAGQGGYNEDHEFFGYRQAI